MDFRGSFSATELQSSSLPPITPFARSNEREFSHLSFNKVVGGAIVGRCICPAKPVAESTQIPLRIPIA